MKIKKTFQIPVNTADSTACFESCPVGHEAKVVQSTQKVQMRLHLLETNATRGRNRFGRIAYTVFRDSTLNMRYYCASNHEIDENRTSRRPFIRRIREWARGGQQKKHWV